MLDVSNTSIVNFDDGPDGIRDGLCAIHTKIVNLHGAPVEVGSMNISDNPNLTSLIGLPKTIIDDLHGLAPKREHTRPQNKHGASSRTLYRPSLYP